MSADGLTWTFSIKPGINYAPPFDDVAITANDFITALKRTANPKTNVGGYSFYYSVIEGFDDYGEGKADEISGLTAVDDQTLEVTLTPPAGDLRYRFTMPATAPIPPLDGEEFGVATGHDKDYGRFLVASGPYMFKGSEAMDFSVPVKDQEPVAGYVPGRSIELVRNPSWSADTDDLRLAYPDEIVTEIGGDNDDLYNKVEQGAIDLVVDGVVPPEKLRAYQTDPELQNRLKVYPADGVRTTSRSTSRCRRSTTSTFARRSTGSSTRKGSASCVAARRRVSWPGTTSSTASPATSTPNTTRTRRRTARATSRRRRKRWPSRSTTATATGVRRPGV